MEQASIYLFRRLLIVVRRRFWTPLPDSPVAQAFYIVQEASVAWVVSMICFRLLTWKCARAAGGKGGGMVDGEELGQPMEQSGLLERRRGLVRGARHHPVRGSVPRYRVCVRHRVWCSEPA
jgi:hypothetical protein